MLKENISNGKKRKMINLIFDIETGANEDAPRLIKPFDKNNPDHVKYGNAKREELRADIEKQQYAIYMSEAKKKFALSAITGKLLCVSYCLIENDETPVFWLSYLQEGITEEILLQELWENIKRADQSGGLVIGFNNKRFDHVFTTQRSWIKGVPVYPIMSGRWYKEWIVDLYEIWMLGGTLQKDLAKFISNSMGSVIKTCGIGEKTGDGSKFEKNFYENRGIALEYAMDDIKYTYALFERFKPFINIRKAYKDEEPSGKADELSIRIADESQGQEEHGEN